MTFHDALCLTDRLETEKRRFKQALEDMDSLRQKEVRCPNTMHISVHPPHSLVNHSKT